MTNQKIFLSLVQSFFIRNLCISTGISGFLRFVNEMLFAESYHIDFMERKNKLNYWKTYLKFQFHFMNTFSIFTLFVIKISKSFTSQPFLKLTMKFQLNGVALSVKQLTQKTVTQILMPEDTMKSHKFFSIKSVTPHKP